MGNKRKEPNHIHFSLLCVSSGAPSCPPHPTPLALSHSPTPTPTPCTACLEEQHLTETKLRAAFDFFDHDSSGMITESDVIRVRSG